MSEQQILIPMCAGERLRQERKSRGIGLGEAASTLHIDEQVMRSIEADKLGHLAPVYRRGYVISYAKFLGFDQDEIEQLLDSIDINHPELRTVFPETGNPNKTDRWLKASSYVLASLLIGTLAWQFTHEAVRLSQDGADRISGTDNSVAPMAGAAVDSRTQSIDGATHINASIAALEAMRLQRQARNSAGSDAWAALQEAEKAATAETPLMDGEFMLQLSASADSWVEIFDARGRQLELDLVRGGSSKQYRGIAPFRIQLGRASAIDLYLDGQAVDLGPFTDGDVTQMLLDGANQGNPIAVQDSDNS